MLYESDRILIDLVEKCGHLYDKSRPDYKDRIKTRNSWQSIAEAMNSTVNDSQCRWNQLRDRFTRERRTLKAGPPSGSGSSKAESPSALFQALQFLDSHIGTRKTRGNILKRSLSPSEDSDNSLSNIYKWDVLQSDNMDVAEYIKRTKQSKVNLQVEMKELEGDFSKVKEESEQENDVNLSNVKASFHELKQCPVFGKNKRKAANDDNDAIQAVSEALQSVKGLCKSVDKADDVSYNFCMTTYSQLKHMSKRKQKIARSRINAIMLELDSDFN